MNELLSVLLTSLRDGYVQVSAFVAVTVLLFGYVQYRTDGALLNAITEHERAQPFMGALMGLTPGCGGAIVMMPLYIRGTVSFGTVVATLIATAGDSAFVILVLAPEAALYSYGIAFATAVLFGYAIDRWGLGVGRVDRAVARLSPAATDGGRRSVGPRSGQAIPESDGGPKSTALGSRRTTTESDGGSAVVVPTGNPGHDYDDGPACAHDHGPARSHPVLTPLSHAAHVLWWVSAGAALVLGITYLVRGAPDVGLALGPSFDGLFTVVGLTGTILSFYLYGVGRHYIGEGSVGQVRESFASAYETFQHAAMETSFVTVWVVVAYLAYEYAILLTGADIGALAAAAGVLAPIGGALIGIIPGCGPQIVLAGVYAEGGIPFSALTANAISQDGDALFPLIAIDKRAAVVASIYTTIPALLVGVALHFLWGPVLGLPQFGFGVLG